MQVNARMIRIARRVAGLPGVSTGRERYAKFYHGTDPKSSERIRKTGYLIDRFTGSKGTRDERGLIWVSKNLDDARFHTYHRGMMLDSSDPGDVFEVKVPFRVKAIDRMQKLTAKQAEVLGRVNLRQDYDPIKPGLEFHLALRKIMQHDDAPQTLKELLPLIGYNAIKDDTGYGIVADRLQAIPVTGDSHGHN